jgi:hypothetical protein
MDSSTKKKNPYVGLKAKLYGLLVAIGNLGPGVLLVADKIGHFFGIDIGVH